MRYPFHAVRLRRVSPKFHTGCSVKSISSPPFRVAKSICRKRWCAASSGPHSASSPCGHASRRGSSLLCPCVKVRVRVRVRIRVRG